ncbi:SDR family NAD(P)-dependent oxidoreductase [Steroidobacter sp.]|uniref:SDR family NAD(P)-dependent oxidoreductase n=1 Tax=Steroidobacter sp. TaxID=1978227 RepID=UPI001A435F90|nr:SDR family NAD(P)-dependent oxidoreductase [Steroidobacter sp.]MBL8270080.1 SDR family NAD(P)-dependent oxidoreductase [Steroidobacter sp.]
MASNLRFDQQVIVVAGGGNGLGRQYCLDLARSGARVVVGGRGTSANDVAAELRALGAEAVSCVADVRDGSALIARAVDAFGRIDGLIVNAGVVRDRSFAKMSEDEWQEVLSIHVNGAFACVKAAWPHMLAQGGGRIVLTTSGAGLHGNFGQANYAAAKGAVIGFMQTLAIEGAAKNVLCNAIAPMALTGMTEGVFDEEMKAALDTALVSPFVLALVHSSSRENGAVIEAGGGWASRLRWQRSGGLRLPKTELTAGAVLARWNEVVSFETAVDYPKSTADSLNAALGKRS